MPTDSGLPIRELQLATLVDEVPAGDEWLHEQKFDGYRILARREGRRVTLLSRRWKDWTAAFPTVAEAVAALPCKRAILDGEVAVVMPDGRTSFQALQNAIGQPGSSLVYFAFDLLALDGEDLRALPLEQRKERLAGLLGGGGAGGRGPGRGTIRYSDHVVGGGAAFFAAACKAGLEGIVSKRRDRPYLPGRGAAWLKIKCVQRQELVIGGFTEPEGSRSGFGALLVGYYQGGRLVYAGKVGTGYTHRTLTELRGRLDALVQRTSPFEPEPPRAWTGPHRHWVRPELVGEVAFAEWTADGRLRHPSFQGLRLDKRPADVIRERPLHEAGGVSERVSERAGSPRPGSGARRSRGASSRGARAAARRPARSRRAG
jgi:bifunctional non-homologous end joining protein LigD